MKVDTLVRILALLISLSSTTTTVAALRGGSWWRLRDTASIDKNDDARKGEGDAASALATSTGGSRELQIETTKRDCEITSYWHPTYSAGWTKGYCSFSKQCNNPRYDTQLECCESAYPGQISGHCLSLVPESERPPVPETYYPKYDEKWEDGYCVNDRPVPGGENGRPQYDTMVECCEGAYGSQLSKACHAKLPPGERPTGSPTTLLGKSQVDVYYPDYDTEWSKAGCTNAKPQEKHGHTMVPCRDRPCYETALECCKGAYAGQMSGACMDLLPEGERPTASPTGIGGPEGWYGMVHTCNGQDWSTATCDNKRLDYGDCGYHMRQPSIQSGDSYETKLECCEAVYSSQYSNACYAWATKCATGTDVCADTSLTFDASVGCDSCGGDNACQGATGSIGITGPYCRNGGSCLGPSACIEFGYTSGGVKVAGSSVGANSCLDDNSCAGASGKIADESCTGASACSGQTGTIGTKSCTGPSSCNFNSGIIKELSCTKGSDGAKDPSCVNNAGTIGHGSCTDHGSCMSLVSGKSIGNGSCKKENACPSLSINVGNNSCNRAAGCGSCTENVPDNQCNDGTNPATGNAYECPSSCG